MNYSVRVDINHPITEDYFEDLELVPVKADTDGQDTQVEKETLKAFNLLRKHLKDEEGIEIGIDSAYRSVEYQTKLMERFKAQYGKEYAENYVALPGTSEHHTGLAIDICPKINGEWVLENGDMLKLTDVFDIIHKNLKKYGFRLSYPQGSKEETGFDYEPWHIRFMGPDQIKQ